VTSISGSADRGGYSQDFCAAGWRKSEGIVHEEQEALGWNAVDLECRRKGDPAKLKVARRLDWIAQRLRMGSAGHLSHLLYRCRDEAAQNKLF
jgi:hypothetical protein